MNTIKEKDFIELDYTGTVKEEHIIFDTTDEKVAKEQDIYNKEMTYGPVIVCVGQRQVIKGLDTQLIGKQIGTYTIDVSSDDAFGKKNSKLLRLVPMKVFTQQQIHPHPGLQINMDGVIGTIRSVSGGRIYVDFNHPLAGKELSYAITIKRIVGDEKEKLDAFLKMQFGQMEYTLDVKEHLAIVTLPFTLPEEAQQELEKKAKELIDSLSGLSFPKPAEPEQKKEQTLVEEKSNS